MPTPGEHKTVQARIPIGRLESNKLSCTRSVFTANSAPRQVAKGLVAYEPQSATSFRVADFAAVDPVVDPAKAWSVRTTGPTDRFRTKRRWSTSKGPKSRQRVPGRSAQSHNRTLPRDPLRCRSLHGHWCIPSYPAVTLIVKLSESVHSCRITPGSRSWAGPVDLTDTAESAPTVSCRCTWRERLPRWLRARSARPRTR